jgi:hypothetical protein
MATGVAQPAAAQTCWDFACGSGWGWALVSAIAWDDDWDGDPWYDDGQFGAGEVALTVMALGVLVEASEARQREVSTPGKDVVIAPTALEALPPGTVEARSGHVVEGDIGAEGLVGLQALAGCDRYVIDHREYRLCGRTWYARQVLWSWGPVPTPPGVTMQ